VIASLASGSVVKGLAAFVAFVVLDSFLHVIWPDRFVLAWLGLS